MSHNKIENTPKIPREGGRKSESIGPINLDLEFVTNKGPTDVEIGYIHSNMSPVDNCDAKVEKIVNISDTEIDFQIEDDMVSSLDVTWECKVCSSSFPTEIKLMEHLQRSYHCVSNNTQCVVCKKYFKGEKGLNIHLAKSSCCKQEEASSPNIIQTDRPLTNPDKTHSVPSRLKFDDERRKLANIPTKKQIRWPQMKEDACWRKFENLVSSQINDFGDAKQQINLLETIIYEEALNMFGTVEKKVKERGRKLSRRQKKLAEVSKNIENLNSALSKANSEEEEAGIICLVDDQKSQRRNLRKAENTRKKRWRRKNMRKNFFRNPFGMAKEILSPRTSSQPEVSLEVLDAYIAEVARDELRETTLGPLEGLNDAKHPKVKFNESNLQERHLFNIIKKKRNASRPGPNQIPYKVYKKCPKLCQYLFKLMKAAVSSDKVPLKWRISDGVFIPKVENPDTTMIDGQYRQIALMNVEAKLFWSMISRKLYNHLIKENKFIDTTVQKGSIQGMPGCWEHTAMVWSALKDARERGSSVATIWLDLANAYGSVPHSLILFALKRYGVPEKWVKLVANYYDGLWGRSTAGDTVSSWHRYEKGIFAGCTVSVILFLIGFNVILEYVSQTHLPVYTLRSGSRLPGLRAFMDDLVIMFKSVPSTQIALTRVVVALKWARMELKPEKSRSVVVVKGRVMDTEPFIVEEVPIPSIQKKPVKALGRIIDGSLSDRKQKAELEEKIVEGLKMLDKSDLYGMMKVWSYQHLLLPRISWKLMIYEIPLSWVEVIEPKINKYLRKWLGISKNVSDVALFCKESPCALPLRSLTKDFKKTKTNAMMQLKQSKDESVNKNVPRLKTGSKWKVEDAVNRAESRIRLNEIIGQGQTSKAGLGLIPRSQVPHPLSRGHRKAVSQMVEIEEDERMFTKAVQQSVQGKWTRWQKAIQRDMTWNTLLASSPRLISFTLGATYDTIASPANLYRWGLSENSCCKLCEKDGCNVSHILSGCTVALSQGRYRYRHNAILRQLAHGVQQFINNSKKITPGGKGIVFVREGQPVQKMKKTITGILHEAKDWKMLVDLDNQLQFPKDIVESNLRPDMLIRSNKENILVIIELTSPCEENFERRHSEKLEKYAGLSSDCRAAGWSVYQFAVEIGARGYAAYSLKQCLRKLGADWRTTKKMIKETADSALRCSFWIWLKRDEMVWQPGNINPPQNKESVVPHRNVVPQQEIIQINNGTRYNDIVQRPMEVVKGLRNLGNTCFMNAVLQCLWVVVESLDLRRKVTVTNGNDQLMEEFWNLMKCMSSGAGTALAPTTFKSTLARKCVQFIGRQQQDAHEFLMVMLEHLSEENPDNAHMFIGNTISSTKCTTCACKSEVEEVFNCLEVEIPPVELTTTSLKECVEESFAPEIIADGWSCSSCNVMNGGALRELGISMAPVVLIIHLKRFKQSAGRLVKVHSPVKLPFDHFRLADSTYELIGVVNHLGSKDAGHYTAWIKIGKSWKLCNDHIIKDMDQIPKQSKEAYILFLKPVE